MVKYCKTNFKVPPAEASALIKASYLLTANLGKGGP